MTQTLPPEIVAPSPDDARVRVRGRKRSALRRWRRRLRWPLALLGALLALAVVDVLVQYVPALAAVEDGKKQVLAARQALMGDISGLDSSRIAEAQTELAAAAEDFGSKSEVLQDGLLSDVAAHLPLLDSQVEAARALRTAGGTGTRFAADIVGLIAKVEPAGAPSTVPVFQRVIAVAGANEPQLAASVADLDAFRQALGAIPSGPLWGPLDSARQTAVKQGSVVLNAAGPALQILQALPRALGPGTHSYLLLLDNPGEERPGGGFIGAVGEVDFKDGAISAETFRGGEYFNDLTPASLKAPAPLNDHLFHDVPWELEDSNWSADFPTAMASVMRFYRLATGRTVDGAISVDPVALGYVLQLLGPVRVPGFPHQLITASNALLELNYITNKARPGDPGKAFLPPFGAQVTEALLHARLGQMPAIATALSRAAQEKHLVLFFADATLEKLVTGAGYGGVLGAPLSDSLMVNDANLSGTKGDLFVTRHFSLVAEVGADGTVHDTLTLSYSNPVQAGANLKLEPNSGAAYRDYLRVYVPETAQVGDMTVSINGEKPRHVSPEAIGFELEREDIADWLVVPRGGSATVIIQYSGPFADISRTPEVYALIWQKQINALTWPVDVTVKMPDGTTRRWSSDLTVDRAWSVAG